MIVLLKRDFSVCQTGEFFAQADIGTEIPDEYADMLPSDAQVLDGYLDLPQEDFTPQPFSNADLLRMRGKVAGKQVSNLG